MIPILHKKSSMLEAATLTIYNASAGTGKTFTLTRAYLSICLANESPYTYRNILALTFTKKAAAEMRTRILNTLKSISQGEENDILNLLCEDLKKPKEVLRERANKCLTEMIHDLSGLSISTIDKFTYRLARSFSYELGINTSAKLRLDQKLIAKQTVDNLLHQAGEEERKNIRKYLQSYVRLQMQNNKSWNISGSLQSVVNDLQREEDREVYQELQKIPLEQFVKTQEQLKNILINIENEISQKAGFVIEKIENSGVPNAAFSYFSNLMAYFSGLKNKTKFRLPTPQVTKLRNSYFVKSKEVDKYTPLLKSAAEAYDNLLTYLEKELPGYFLLLDAASQLTSVALTGALIEAYQGLKSEEQFVHLGEFKEKIYELTRTDTADYIFERLGDRYQYFFIDEFQDTSRIQWENLKPLALHAMANNGSTMLVGDPKQSIYRWRGSNPQMFLDLIKDKDQDRFSVIASGKKVERYKREEENLHVNYRSGKAIVEFVRQTFLQDEENNTPAAIAYSKVTSESAKNFDGYVHLSYVNKRSDDDEEHNEYMRQYTLGKIAEALEQYQQSDIAILVRGAKDGKRIAQWIAEEQATNRPELRVLSNESFIVEDHPPVKVIIQAIRFLGNPLDANNKIDLLLEMLRCALLPWQENRVHENISAMNALKTKDFHQEIRKYFPRWNMAELEYLPLPEIALRLVQQFALDISNDVFLQAFINHLREVQQDNPMDVYAFTTYWDDPNRGSINVEAPESINAITILTIHKSKGLEWPVVIIPYADWPYDPMKNSTTWFPNFQKNAVELPHLKVSLKQIKQGEEGDYLPEYREVSSKHYQEVVFDNLNLLYVAFTRASHRLYIHTAVPKKNADFSTFGFLMNKYFSNSSEDSGEMEWGTKAVIPSKAKSYDKIEKSITWQSNREGYQHLQIGRRYSPGVNDIEAIKRGNTIHEILQFAELDIKKIPAAWEKMLKENRVRLEEKEELLSAAESVLNNEILLRLKSNAKSILTEKSILIPGGEVLRPDVWVELQNGEICIIDYKSGAPLPKHSVQLNRYLAAAHELSGKKTTGYLVYVSGQVVEVVT
jgi:ATP-dependent exoDNAse (exonuclease V) beta subunit